MRNKKKLSLVVLLIAIIAMSGGESVLARGNGQGLGSDRQRVDNRGAGMRQNATGDIVDTNNNGIPDGQEDFDGDGVINRDDEDYEKKYINIKDDDGDGIPNRDDEDYTRPLDGSGRPDAARQNRVKTVNRNEVRGQKTVGNNGAGNGVLNSAPGAGRGVQNGLKTEQRAKNTNTVRNRFENLVVDEQSMENIVNQDIIKLRKERGLKRFFFGVNQDVTKVAEDNLRQIDDKIEELEQLSTSGDIDSDLIQEQIDRLTTIKDQLQAELDDSEGFSLFGWIGNIFK